jgi:hypothetical protein
MKNLKEVGYYKMDILFKRYEELLDRLYKSEDWLIRNNYNEWEEVKVEDFKVYQLRKKLIMQIESIQSTLHKNLDLRYGGNNERGSIFNNI